MDYGDMVWKALESVPSNGRPTEKSNTWTVLAGVVITRSQPDNSPPSHEVVSLATGTKCLGQNKLLPGGAVLNDSHAEVLVRRNLKRFLMLDLLRKEQSKYFDVRESKSSSPQLEASLKPGINFHLYISQTPCGDSSLFDLVVKHPLSNSAQRKDESKASGKRKHDAGLDTNRTGAKPVSHEDSPLGVLRTKSGRSDLPKSHTTLSMSCSDKIALWTVLGFQGNPILGNKQRDLVMDSLRRALLERTQYLCGVVDTLPQPEINISTHPFPFVQYRDGEQLHRPRPPHPLSLHWHAHTGHQPHLEVTLGVTGLKQGAARQTKPKKRKKRKLDSDSSQADSESKHPGTTDSVGNAKTGAAAEEFPYAKTCSKVCKRNLFILGRQLLSAFHHNIGTETNYADFKLPSHHQKLKQRVLAADGVFGAWVRKPKEMQQFSVDSAAELSSEAT